MSRFVACACLFFLMFALQTSFITSLPPPFRFMPILFAFGMYALQYVRGPFGPWWLVLQGAFLDLSRMGVMPGEIVVYLTVSLIGIFLTRRLFSHRTLSGTVGCSLVCLAFLHALHTVFFFGQAWITGVPVPWSDLGLFFLVQAVFLTLWASLLFFFFQKTAVVLRRLFVFFPHQTS
ncbi:hypothetical protein HY734_00980 [Candidatus Uhrbacteria bacterium]|nr:hypothetical protein [Candidatus Uhrbacteria bacterium]